MARIPLPASVLPASRTPVRPAARRHSRAPVVILASALLAWGCVSAPPGPGREDVPLPGGFSEGGAQPLAERWWRHFGDPRLDGLMDRVVEANFSLAAARSRLEQARAAARVAFGAQLPTLDINADATATRRQPGIDTEQYTAGAAAGYEVDLWGRLDSAADAAAFEAEASAGDLRAAAITLTARTATTYYGVLRQRALADLIRQQERTNRQVEELAELRYRNGAASIDELLRQRQLVERTVAELATAVGELQRLRAELAALLAVPGPDALELTPGHELVEVPPLPATGVPSVWLNRRPDLRAAFLRVRGADADLASAIANRYPRLDLSASIESLAERPSSLFADWISRLVGNLTAPVFRGGQLAGEVERQRAARAVAFNEFAQTALDAVAEVESVLWAERTDRARRRSLERQVELGRRALEQLKFSYRNGAVDFLDVLDAQTTLQTSQRQLLQVRWELVVDRIDLARAIAGGWEVEAPSGTVASGQPAVPGAR